MEDDNKKSDRLMIAVNALLKEEIEQAVRDNPARFESVSHFIRVGAMGLLTELKKEKEEVSNEF